MKVSRRNRADFTIELTPNELFILRGALGRAIIGPRNESVDSFRQRFGWNSRTQPPTLDDLRTLRDRLKNHGSAAPTAASIGMKMENQDTSNAAVTLGRRELTLLVRALTEISYGVQIPDWEFPTLLGFTREDARVLLNQLHRLLVRPA